MWLILFTILLTAAGTKAAEYAIEWFKKRKLERQAPTLVRAEDVAAWGWSGERLLKELIKLDKKLLGDSLNEEREGTVAQWAPVFMAHTDGWILLATSDRQIIGYFSFFALKDDAYQKAESGILLDSEVTTAATNALDVPGVYKAYFILLGALPEYPRAGARLLEAFFDQLEGLARHGVLFEEMLANAFTPDGKRICEGFGMTKVCDHRDFGEVYRLRLNPWPERLSFKRWAELKALYEEKVRKA